MPQHTAAAHNQGSQLLSRVVSGTIARQSAALSKRASAAEADADPAAPVVDSEPRLQDAYEA